MKNYERIVKAFGMTNMLIEADLHQIEENFSIDHYCPAIAFSPLSKSRLISGMKGVLTFFDFNFD